MRHHSKEGVGCGHEGLNDRLAKRDSLIVYPKPAQLTVTIAIPTELGETNGASAKFYDLYGKEIMSETLSGRIT